MSFDCVERVSVVIIGDYEAFFQIMFEGGVFKRGINVSTVLFFSLFVGSRSGRSREAARSDGCDCKHKCDE